MFKEDTTIEAVLKTIETLYAQKAYRDALDYLAKNQSSLTPGLWHYNMGTILAKLEDWPLSRYHLTMASLRGYSSTELELNQKIVEEKLSVDKWEKPLTSKDYLIRGALLGSEGVFTFLGLVIMIIGILLLRKMANRKAAILTLLSSLTLFGVTYWVKSWDKSIVLAPQVVREGPSVIFGTNEELPPGIMIITVRQGEWLKIIYPARFEGWIQDLKVKELR